MLDMTFSEAVNLFGTKGAIKNETILMKMKKINCLRIIICIMRPENYILLVRDYVCVKLVRRK